MRLGAGGILLAEWRATIWRQPRARCVFSSDSGSLSIDVPPSDTSRWRAIVRVLRSPIDALSCALFPACCALCGSPLPRISPAPICDICWTEIVPLEGLHCELCAEPVDRLALLADAEHPLCRSCRLAPPPFQRTICYGPYGRRMQQAIHALKYDGMRPLARGLGVRLAEAIAQLGPEAAAGLLVVPVPLHRTKSRQRGFNQARLLAVHALEALGKSHPEWRLELAPATLMRLRPTASQADRKSVV